MVEQIFASAACYAHVHVKPSLNILSEVVKRGVWEWGGAPCTCDCSGASVTAVTRCWSCRYVLLKGVNDSLEDAEQLGHMLRGVYCAVNLIMYNSHEGAPFEAAETMAVLQFRDTVRTYGKLCTIRESKVLILACYGCYHGCGT